MVRAVPSERAGRCACSSVASGASPEPMALTPRCGPRRRAGPELDRPAARPRSCTAKALRCARMPHLSAHALRPAARVAARCQPVAFSHPPPSCRAKVTASRSTAPLRVVLTGMHHAHRRHAQHRHAQRHYVGTMCDNTIRHSSAATRSSCAGSHRSRR